MKNILFLAPHTSTGGMPQFLLKRLQVLKGSYNLTVVEYQCVSDIYTVQRQKIKTIADQFITLGENKLELIDIIKSNSIDIVHIENEAEGFDHDLMNALYSNDRKYRIVETCHNVSFNPQNKVFFPDAFAYCSPYHEITFKYLNTYYGLIEYPIEKQIVSYKERQFSCDRLKLDISKKHVLNVGLWTKGKNQSEGIEIAKKYPHIEFHFVGNQAENFKEYWQPLMANLPKNVKVWGERSDISDFMIACDIFMFNSVNECNPIVLKEAIGYGLNIYAHNLPQYCGKYDDYITEDFESSLQLYKKNKIYNAPNQLEEFKVFHNEFYEKVMNLKVKEQPKSTYKFISHFVDGAYFEIVGNSQSDFKIQFSDSNENVIYKNIIKCNSWVKLNRKYYTDYTIKVWENENLVYDEKVSLKGKKVMICFDSSSLGDTLAWMPYCDLFQLTHDCELVVSTFKNFLFEGQYPNIRFVEPATVENNLYAKYNLGWFYDKDKEPMLPNTIPLQQTASNILGLEYVELKPKIIPIRSNLVVGKYVTIATNSTSGCKFWTRENWQEVIHYLHNKGYNIINTSLEDSPFINCITLADKSIISTMECIKGSEFFIGLSSGLSWLAWSLDKEVIMISNFTKEEHEFSCHRLTNTAVCNGCWNNKNFKFDKSDFDWCPINKGYDKQFECQKSITPQMVIDKIETLI